MTAVGPVIAKEGPVSKFVFGDDQAIGGDPGVYNPVASLRPFHGPGNGEGNPIVLVKKEKLPAILGDLLHLHA